MDTAGQNGDEFNIEKLFPRCRPKQRGKQREKTRRTYARRDRASRRAATASKRKDSSDSSASPKANNRCHIPPSTKSTRSINQHRLNINHNQQNSAARGQTRNDQNVSKCAQPSDVLVSTNLDHEGHNQHLSTKANDEAQTQNQPHSQPQQHSAKQTSDSLQTNLVAQQLDQEQLTEASIDQSSANPYNDAITNQQTSDTNPTQNHIISSGEDNKTKPENVICQEPSIVQLISQESDRQLNDLKSLKVHEESSADKYLHIFVYDEKNPEEPITLAVDRTISDPYPRREQQESSTSGSSTQNAESFHTESIPLTRQVDGSNGSGKSENQISLLNEDLKEDLIDNSDVGHLQHLQYNETKYREQESSISHVNEIQVVTGPISRADESIDSLILLHERVHGLAVPPETLLDQQRQPLGPLSSNMQTLDRSNESSRTPRQSIPGSGARQVVEQPSNEHDNRRISSNLSEKSHVHSKPTEKRTAVIPRLDCLSEVESEREHEDESQDACQNSSTNSHQNESAFDRISTCITTELDNKCDEDHGHSILPNLNIFSDADSDFGPDDQNCRSRNSSVANVSKPQATDRSVANFNVAPDSPEKMPISAHVFPKLNEGLSSGAESADDDAYEDDECAADADNDDDDDCDDDDGDDDDIDLDARPTNLISQDVVGTIRQQQQIQQQSSGQHKRLTPRLIPSLNSVTEGISQMQFSSTGQIRPNTNGHTSNDINSLIKPDYLIQANNIDHRNGVHHNDQSIDSKSSDVKQLSYGDNSIQLPDSTQLNFWQQQQQQHPSSSLDQRNSDLKTNNTNQRNDRKANQFSSDTDDETDRLLGSQRTDQLKMVNSGAHHDNLAMNHGCPEKNKTNSATREVLIEGVLFIVKYLGSTQLECDGQSSKHARVNQAEQAVIEVKQNMVQDGNSQPYAEVQLFISTEKIMVLDQKHKKIMMDHSLRTISYIADIGEILVLMARRKHVSSEVNDVKPRRASKMICHVFESDEAQLIAQSMNQAFQVAYVEFMKANGIDDTSFLPKEMDYQEVLNSQEMSTEELEMFAEKEKQKEVIVPKKKGEILGIGIVESGWGSILPTVVIASLKSDGPAYRCKKLSVGDQILSVDGNSLVGLPLAECQEIIGRTRKHTVAKLSLVSSGITVEVKIKRPDTKYQLGFSVQNGVICSLLRGGIAERGGVRVGHRIMSINDTAVVGVPHEKIVNLLANSVGEIRMKTCLTSLYRLILGQENPVHF